MAGVAIALVAASALASDATEAPVPADAEQAAEVQGVGEIFVRANVQGPTIHLDGTDTGIAVPGVLVDVPVGPHLISLSSACQEARARVEVRPGAIERLELELAPSEGSLTVKYAPAGASVLLDEVELGTTPLEGFVVPCGEHQLRISSGGYGSFTRTIQVGASESTVIEGTLVALEVGRLAVKVVPAGAEVLVDGVVVGTAPVEVADLEAGLHRVLARAPAFEEDERAVEIADGALHTLEIELAPIVPPLSLGERLGLDRVRWGRLAIDIGLAAVSTGSGIAAYRSLQRSDANYESYLQLSYADEPQLYYEEQVLGPRRTARILAVGAGVAAAGSAAGFVLLPVVEPTCPVAAPPAP